MTQLTIDTAINNFLRERRSRSSAPGTIKFYRSRLNLFQTWCKTKGVEGPETITSDQLREFILSLEGHTPGGIHAVFRAVHALFYWYEEEYEPAGWRNPIKKLHAPKVPENLLDPADTEEIDELVSVCGDDTFGLRDRAIILFLQDTGVRASELLSLSIGDLDMIERQAFIRCGKGGKPRPVFFDKRTKRALKAYLGVRPDVKDSHLFLNNYQDKLQYDGLRAMILRRAQQAGISEPPTLHSFRRAFALNGIRNKVDILTLMRLLGHHSTQVLQRYVKLSTDDLRNGHDQAAAA